MLRLELGPVVCKHCCQGHIGSVHIAALATGLQRTLAQVPDLSIFAAALNQVGLLDALGNSGDLSGVTLFAPRWVGADRAALGGQC